MLSWMCQGWRGSAPRPPKTPRGVIVTEPAIVQGPDTPEESLYGRSIEPARPRQSAAGWGMGV